MTLMLYEITRNFGALEETSRLYFADNFNEMIELAKRDGLTWMRKYVRTKAEEGFDKEDNFELNGDF